MSHQIDLPLSKTPKPNVRIKKVISFLNDKNFYDRTIKRYVRDEETLRAVRNKFTLEQLPWIVGCNYHLLRKGKIPAEISGERQPVLIIKCLPIIPEEVSTYKRKRIYRVEAIVLGGSMAGLKLSAEMSEARCIKLLVDGGYSKKSGVYPVQSPRELSGFYAGLGDMTCTPQSLANCRTEDFFRLNRVLVRARYRNKFKCPFNYTVPCFQCDELRSDCPASLNFNCSEKTWKLLGSGL